MTTSTIKPWEPKRTDETRSVEALLGAVFDEVDAYRYNSASIRVRVKDPRFEGMPREKRDAMIEEQIETLPPDTQRDIVTLLAFAPSELSEPTKNLREFLLNNEFEDWNSRPMF